MTSHFNDQRACASDDEICEMGATTFGEMQAHIDNARIHLTPPDMQLGVWESFELNNAASALRAGFPELARFSVRRALWVNRLPEAEYAFGFKNARVQKDEGHSQDAHRLLDQSVAAEVLLRNEGENARKLGISQEITAAALEKSQLHAAIKLADEEKGSAEKMRLTHISTLNSIKEGDDKLMAQQHVQEQILFWMSGSYICEPPAYDYPSQDSRSADIAALDDSAAAALKARQEQTAALLKETQKDEAASLKAGDEVAAHEMKSGQEQAACLLKNRQEHADILKQIHENE